METVAGYPHVYIAPDPVRTYERYYFHKDINGQYVVQIQEYNNPTLEADYAYVHFTLPFNTPLSDGNIYVMGELTNWGKAEGAKMTYNDNRKAYETVLYLKQGYYNYVYGYSDSQKPVPEVTFIEGNHFDTENNYTILIYYRPFGTRYDQLIGIQTVNSLY